MSYLVSRIFFALFLSNSDRCFVQLNGIIFCMIWQGPYEPQSMTVANSIAARFSLRIESGSEANEGLSFKPPHVLFDLE